MQKTPITGVNSLIGCHNYNAACRYAELVDECIHAAKERVAKTTLPRIVNEQLQATVAVKNWAQIWY
jgi:hypothetical protein